MQARSIKQTCNRNSTSLNTQTIQSARILRPDSYYNEHHIEFSELNDLLLHKTDHNSSTQQGENIIMNLFIQEHPELGIAASSLPYSFPNQKGKEKNGQMPFWWP